MGGGLGLVLKKAFALKKDIMKIDEPSEGPPSLKGKLSMLRKAKRDKEADVALSLPNSIRLN